MTLTADRYRSVIKISSQAGNEKVPTPQSSEFLKQSFSKINKRNKTYENKASHRLFEVNYTKTVA